MAKRKFNFDDLLNNKEEPSGKGSSPNPANSKPSTPTQKSSANPHTTMRVWTKTLKSAKIKAAQRDMKMVEYLEWLVEKDKPV